MDDIDKKILQALKENAKTTASEISGRVSLSVPAVSERIRKLEESGIIEQFTVRINREKTGYKTLAFIFVTIEKPEYIENFRNSVMQFDCVLECHHITGDHDYLLKVLVEDIKTLDSFISASLKKIKGILKTSTIISLSTIKEKVNV